MVKINAIVHRSPPPPPPSTNVSCFKYPGSDRVKDQTKIENHTMRSVETLGAHIINNKLALLSSNTNNIIVVQLL